MTDPLLYACLEDLREKMLITRSEAGATVVEKANEEIKRLNKVIESQLKTIQNYLKNNSLSLTKTKQ
jgi:hypothetical protein